MNPLEAFRGVQAIRCNGGAEYPARERLVLRGAAITDDPARKRTVAERTNTSRVRIDVYGVVDGRYWLDNPSDSWFGLSVDFDEADEVYIDAAGPDVELGGFGVPRGTINSRTRKVLVNFGEHPFSVTNFRFYDDSGEYDDPGMVQGYDRILHPGEALRMVWDPTGQRWLVSNGALSGEYVTFDGEQVTFDDEPVTFGV